MRKRSLRRQFKINKIHVITQKHVGWLQPLHIDLLDLIVLTNQRKPGKQGDQPCDDQGLTNGIMGGAVGFFVFIIHVHI